MARKPGQIIARGQSVWLVSIYQGRDPDTGTRKYHNQTIHGRSAKPSVTHPESCSSGKWHQRLAR